MKHWLLVFLLLPVPAQAGSFTLGAGSYDADASYMSKLATGDNYGSGDYIQIYEDGSSTGRYRAVADWPELKDSLYGEAVTSCSLFVKLHESDSKGATTMQFGVYGLLRHSVETEICWDSAQKDPGGVAWTTAGADGSGTDRTSTMYDVHTGVGDTIAGEWFAFDVTSLVQTWDGTDTANAQGFMIAPIEDSHNWKNILFCSDDHATTGNRPYVKVATTEGGEVLLPRRRKLLTGGR
ncbi:MAG TPA: DNRLRE domain-containing protein [Acidobacteriota bacterium]|nr:DNRLRE domain-containing protein [Acidobacteriota bacterium]